MTDFQKYVKWLCALMRIDRAAAIEVINKRIGMGNPACSKLINAFDWEDDSEKGVEYWANLHDKLKNSELIMSEKNFRGRLNAAASIAREEIDWMPVENRASRRMPDQHFINCHGMSGWVELKYIETLSKKIEFQAGQARWARKYWERGGACYIAISCKETSKIYFYDGCDAERLERLGHIGDIDYSVCFSSPRRELLLIDWLAKAHER